MAGKLTFAMLKPDAVAAGNAGAILAHVEKSGFAIKAMRMHRLTRVEAEAFYAVHRERGFYGELVEFMSSGPVVAMALEAPDAVLAWRTAIGATDPAEAGVITVMNTGLVKGSPVRRRCLTTSIRRSIWLMPPFAAS